MADDDRQAALNAIDLKGNIVLKEFGDTALLFRPQNNYEPFVVAYGYDKAAGEWSHGSYHTDLGHAFEEANPEIIEDACVRWQRGDIAVAMSRVRNHLTGHGNGDVYADVRNGKPVFVKIVPCPAQQMNALEKKLIKAFNATSSYNNTAGGSRRR